MVCCLIIGLVYTNIIVGRFAGKFGIDCSLPGKWGWFVMEFVSPIMFIASVMITRPTWTPFQVILTSAWLIHYVNRSIIYPLRATSMAPLHVLAFLCSIVFNMINGYTNGMWIGRHSNSIHQYKFWVGISLWAVGFVSNIHHDTLLFKLRKRTRQDKQKNKYSIPHGGLFEYVSCPNYLSETMEWIGFTIATNSSIPAIIFVAATISNLFPRAIRTHEWYKNEFKNYPKSRKAIIPYIY